MRSASDWVVVKFGGTSVSTLVNWKNIALIVKRRVAAGNRVLVVHSAVTKITDLLEKLLVAAEAGKPDEPLKAIEDRHRQLTTELGLDVSPQLQGYFDELRQMANGIALVRELSDRTRARVMSNGELMATEIGSRFLRQQGIDVTASTSPGWTRVTCSRRRTAAHPPRPRCCRLPVRSRRTPHSRRSSTIPRQW
jgi:bifunctional diaminopimelate decarboxylase / aspartate kinase